MNDQTSKKAALVSRLLAVYLLAAAWGGLLFARLVDLQVFRSQELRKQAEQQQKGFAVHGAQRGDILDRRLETLAINVQVDSLVADPKLVKEPLATARLLSPVLQRPVEELFQKLTVEGRFVLLERTLVPEQTARIKALDLTGVFLNKNSKRFYPGRRLACHLVGFVSVDNEGLAGLEYRYNDQVKGEKSRVYMRFDAHRKSFQRAPPSKSARGNVLVLNIDQAIQFLAEQALQDAIESSGAVNGSAIVMHPGTGEVLAMASHPAFNPNLFVEARPEAQRNRAILDMYEPGSTFKIITLAAVLNEGLADLTEQIDCRAGTLRLAGKVYKEASHSFEDLTVAEVFAKSSNIGTIKLALRLGPERFHDYIRAFGFGQKTGVDLPGEEAGLFRPVSEWSKVSIGALAIGQEVGVTPLQMIRAVSAVANGGYLVRPYVVRQILSPEGDLIAAPQPERRRILDPRTSWTMKQALALVVREGTGSAARLNGYSSGGKTGTAQKIVNGRYSDTKYVASYVGFAPLEEPRLAAIVVLNEPDPRKGYYGGKVAGPAFKEIMERSLIHLNVPHDREEEFLLAAKQPPAGEPGPISSVSAKEVQLPRAGLERAVLELMKEDSAAAPAGTSATIETGLLRVPDFSGLSLREAARECARLGLALKISGSGTAVGQRPAPGTPVGRGAVCEVFFSGASNKGNTSVGTDEIARQSSSRLSAGGNR